KKGTWFSIEGRLNTNNYEAKDGTKRYANDIVVSEIDFKAL
ncbi:MAG: single-stranded DNA-binding protein, partial [Sphingobacteriales bacterium]